MSALPVEPPNKSYYASHLSEVDKSHSVTSTEDIYTENGLLLAKKGARVSPELATKLLQHKLLKPIEKQVGLEKSLQPKDLLDNYNLLFEKYADIGTIHQNHIFTKKLIELLYNADINSVLMQKLTVMSIRLPETYEKSLFCAWLCALISQEMKLSSKEIHDAFVAGLFHDIGLLHIDPEILYKKAQLSAGEWRAIQSHVVIGFLIFQDADNSNREIAQAILEHHESCDGTGYPRGLLGAQLNMLGQILGMADSLQAVRTNRLTKDGQNMRDALPFLHMNSVKHHLEVYKTTCLIILRSNLSPSLTNTEDSFEKLVRLLLSRVDVLQDAVVVLRILNDLIQQKTETKPYQKLISVITPVIDMIITSGMVRDELILWLKGLILKEDTQSIRDLLEMDLMQNELFWQLKKVVRVVNEYIENTDLMNQTQKEHLKKLTDYIYQTLQTDNLR